MLTMPIDYKIYPPNWKTEIVPAVIARAGNCCENCNVPNGSMQWRGSKKVHKMVNQRKILVDRTFPYESREAAERDGCHVIRHSKIVKGQIIYYDRGIYQVKVVLTVAHLDHDETNWNVTIDRLRAWCQLCHLQYDAAEKYRRSMEGKK